MSYMIWDVAPQTSMKRTFHTEAEALEHARVIGLGPDSVVSRRMTLLEWIELRERQRQALGFQKRK